LRNDDRIRHGDAGMGGDTCTLDFLNSTRILAERRGLCQLQASSLVKRQLHSAGEASPLTARPAIGERASSALCVEWVVIGYTET
jgi:hypothetical protein